MPWALGRRLLIISILGAFVALLGIGAWFLFAYEGPSCSDGEQNQDEEGVDCGGSCAYLCSVGLVPPSVEFARYVSPQSGRTDVIAYIENSNAAAAARGVSFTIELLNSANAVVATKEGSVDLPPSSVVPVFVPNFFSGSQDVARVFLEIDTATFRWFSYRDERTVPRVLGTTIEAGDAPRITAQLANDSAVPLRGVRAVITVFNAAGNAIAASQTVVDTIPAQGEARAVFTWRIPFPETPSRVEVIPVLPL